jgi:branched-subunit amino acid ABC-type transport system permease component
MISFFTNLINGLSLGSIYAIIAIGYTMVYGIAKMLNFAHGDVIMVGAFTAFTVISLQFKGRTNTTVSWHSGRVPEETANILMEDITERMNNQVVPG